MVGFQSLSIDNISRERRESVVVYVDILFFINTVINCAVLMITEKLMKKDCRLYRILLGALVGAVFSLAIMFGVKSRLLLLLLRVIASLCITLTAFGWRSPREFMKVCLCNILISAVFSGFFILIYQLFKPPNMLIVNDVVYFQVNPLWLTALTAVIYLILLLLYKLFYERIKSTVVSLQFTVQAHTYSCVGKIDTGCSLQEPFSSAPVIIADRTVFSVDTEKPFRVIPYSVLGGGSYLFAVKADSVVIDKRPIEKTVYIASTDIENRNYQAIINSDIAR